MRSAHPLQSTITATTLLMATLFAGEGCSWKESAAGAGKMAGGAVHGILHPMDLFRGRKKKAAPPPRAESLRDVGTIRSVSQDGGYAIIELSPGAAVSTGAKLIIAGPDSETIRLKAGEISYPCCVADIEEGHPSPGDAVKR
jgi:hypothetical protein